jgi:hypothetical protein
MPDSEEESMTSKTEVPEMEEFTIPLEKGRPIVSMGVLLSEIEWRQEYTNYGPTFTAPARARLIRLKNGDLAYVHERNVTRNALNQIVTGNHSTISAIVEWEFYESAIWTDYDAIRADWLTMPVKRLIRASKDGVPDAVTYESIDGHTACVIQRKPGRDIAFAGVQIAEGTSSPGGASKVATSVWQLKDGRYLVVRQPAREVFYQVCATPLDVYDVLVWKGFADGVLFRSEGAGGRIEVQPSPDALKLLIDCAAADEAFQPIAYRLADGPDPVGEEYARRAARFEARLQHMREEEAAARAKAAEEAAEREAAWQAQHEIEERQQRELAARLDEEAARHEEAEAGVSAAAPVPATRLARDLLEDTLRDENAPPALRLQAAGWLVLADKVGDVGFPAGY